MLAHAGIPLKFWEEAFLFATYIINRIPPTTGHDISPLKNRFMLTQIIHFLKFLDAHVSLFSVPLTNISLFFV